MAHSDLEELREELAAFWAEAFKPYVGTDWPGERLVARIVGQLLDLDGYGTARSAQLAAEYVVQITHTPVKEFGRRRILIAASENGVWASEMTVVASLAMAAGYEVVLASETGQPPHMLSVSRDPAFLDGPLGIPVVSDEEAKLAERFLQPDTTESQLMKSVLNLSEIARPPLVAGYVSDPEGTMKSFREGLETGFEWATQFDALVIAGGSGSVAGFSMHGGLQHLVLAFDRLRKPIVAECNGVFALVHAIDPRTGRSILDGRLATTHSHSHEYRRGGWGWAKPDEAGEEQWTLPGADGNPIVDSEPIVRAAVGPNGAFLSPPETPYAVAVDDNVITARTTPDGAPATAALLAMLDGEPPFCGRYFIRDDSGFTRVD